MKTDKHGHRQTYTMIVNKCYMRTIEKIKRYYRFRWTKKFRKKTYPGPCTQKSDIP